MVGVAAVRTACEKRVQCILSDGPLEITCREKPVVFLWTEEFNVFCLMGHLNLLLKKTFLFSLEQKGNTIPFMVGLAAVRTASEEKRKLVWHIVCLNIEVRMCIHIEFPS